MLSVEYWGGFNGSKTFDIMIEGKVIATENVSAIQPRKVRRYCLRYPTGAHW
jgi:hypothetical protein